MRMAKRPEPNTVTRKAVLAGKVRGEAARNRAASVSRIGRVCMSRRAPVRKYHDLAARLLQLGDLAVQPSQVAGVCLVLGVDVPVVRLKVVVDAEADCHFARPRDKRE